MGSTTYLEYDQVKLFLDEIPGLKLRKMTHKQVRLMFETLFYGALRVSEVLQITPESLVNGKIRLYSTKGGVERCKCSKWVWRPTRLISCDPYCKKCGGTGKYRIPVNASIISDIYEDLVILSRTVKSGERLFPLSRVRVWQYADSILNCRTHTFRHSFLTYLLEEGFNIRELRDKARHKNIATTSNYIDSNIDYTIKKEEKVVRRI